MSVIINVADNSRNDSLIYKDSNHNVKPHSNSDIDTNQKLKKLQSDPTSQIVTRYVTENSKKNFSKIQTTKDNEKSGHKITIINSLDAKSISQDKKKLEKNSVSVDIHLNLNNSLMSTGSFPNKEPKSKSIHENSFNNSNTSYKKQTVQTSTEKNICDEIEIAQAEAEKCIERME